MDTQNTVKEILESGVTQSQLAARLKCSQSLVSAFLNGKRGSCVSFEIGVRLAAAHKEAQRKRRTQVTPP